MWGRSKLPRNAWPINYKGVPVKFKIIPRTDERQLPLAHTCFFLLELPPYKTRETLLRKLLAAIEYGAGEGFDIA